MRLVGFVPASGSAGACLDWIELALLLIRSAFLALSRLMGLRVSITSLEVRRSSAFRRSFPSWIQSARLRSLRAATGTKPLKPTSWLDSAGLLGLADQSLMLTGVKLGSEDRGAGADWNAIERDVFRDCKPCKTKPMVFCDDYAGLRFVPWRASRGLMDQAEPGHRFRSGRPIRLRQPSPLSKGARTVATMKR